MTVTANGIDLTQPPQGAATTAGIRANFAAIDAALTSLTNSVNSGTTLAAILAAIAAIPGGTLGTIEKTGTSSVGTYTVSSYAKTLLSAATAANWRTTLGLGSAATSATTDFASAGHTHAALSPFTGDSGAGGVLGTVPAPAAGDAAATKFLAADGTWKQLQGTLGGNLTASGKVISQPELSSYRETFYNAGNVTTTYTVNYNNGTYQKCVLTGNTAISFSNFPTSKGGAVILFVTQDGTGSRTASWTGVKWAGGTAPVVAAGAGQVSIITIVSPDGTTYYGFNSGLNFS